MNPPSPGTESRENKTNTVLRAQTQTSPQSEHTAIEFLSFVKKVLLAYIHTYIHVRFLTKNVQY